MQSVVTERSVANIVRPLSRGIRAADASGVVQAAARW
jgi:hypothetical protein